jgi:hypothetical protein
MIVPTNEGLLDGLKICLSLQEGYLYSQCMSDGSMGWIGKTIFTRRLHLQSMKGKGSMSEGLLDGPMK